MDNKKRLDTNLLKYGKKSNYGSNESIIKNFKSVLKNKMNLTDEFLITCTEEEIRKLYGDYVRSQSKNRIIQRIHNLFGFSIDEIKLFDNDKFIEFKKKCYIQALINKGKSSVIEYNLGDITKMTDSELLKFSGYKKKINSKGKSQEYKRKRQITHLCNFYGTTKEFYAEFSDAVIFEKFRMYMHDSGQLKHLIESGRGGKWEKGFVVLPRLGLTIFVRSSYEKYFLYECDKNLYIKTVEFNLKGLQYTFDNITHWYFPDFILEFDDGSKTMIEIKSKWQLSDEKTKKKIDVGIEHCKNNNMKFNVLTEDELFNKEKTIWQQL